MPVTSSIKPTKDLSNLDPQKVADAVRKYYVNRDSGGASFGRPRPAATPEEQLNAMPNASKLTKFERGVYGALPGITTWMEGTRIMGNTVSEQLDKFNKGWAGKALEKLDILAEGFERAVGVGEQALQKGVTNFDWSEDNLKAAWYAGSLYWDTANLPIFKRDKAGNVIGLQITEDLPGVDGMADARVKLKRLMESGVEPQRALAMVRDDYYNGLGALSIRATLNDTWGHALGDPLNLITGALKPLEALKVRRLTALTGKIAGGAEELLSKSDEVARLAKVAGAVGDDALKNLDEAYQLAGMAGDTKRAAQYAKEAAEAAKKLGKVDEAARLESEAARFAGMTAEEAAGFSDEALKALGKKKLTTGDKLAIMMTGGDPFRPSAFGKAVERVPILGGVAKAFQLTPESKSKELLTMLSDNISANVVSRLFDDPAAEAKFMSYIRRVSKGATGIEYGHALTTLEGRTAQAFLKGADGAIELMFSRYQKFSKERDTLSLLSNVLGDSPSKLLRLMDESPEVIVDMLYKRAGVNPVLDAMMQTGEISTENLRAMKKMLGGVPYNKEMFFAQAMDAIETQAMRQAVTQFGVTAKGTLTRWSDAVKSAESLAFLRMNPGYPIRNKLNNDFTMIARGLFGLMPDSAIGKFWDDFGVVPKRLGEAITPAQEAVQKEVLSEADRILKEALDGGYYTTPDKVKEFFSKIDLGKLDTAKHWGQMIEQRASRKAFTLGTQQFLRKYFKPKQAREYINPKVLDQIADVAPEFEQHFTNAIRASGAIDKKFDEILGANLNLNVDSIMDEVTQGLQTEVRDLLGDELLEHVHQNLPKALNEGTLDTFRLQTRQMMDKHIEDLFAKQLENVVEHVKAQATAGGANVWSKKLAEAQEVFWGAHIEHAIRMPEATRLAREASQAGDYKAARALWKQEQQDAARFYDRAFRRVDAYIKGLEEANADLAAKGARLPWGEVRNSFREWQDGWKQFFVEKNKMMDEFWDELTSAPKGQRPKRTIDDVQKQTRAMYDAMTAKEDEIMQRIDDTLAQTIQDPQARKAYMNARDTLSNMRRQDKKDINRMYELTANMRPEDRQAAWNQFWNSRVQKYQQMRAVEAAGSAIQQGDPNAVQLFSAARQAAEQGTPGAGKFDVFKEAEKYGVDTSTAKGGRNERRVLNTINKYSGRTKVDVTKKVVEVPRSDLPEAVSQRMSEWAQQLKRDLGEGEPGMRVRKVDRQPGDAPIRIGSTNPNWYKELYSKGLRKPAIDKALDKIIKDQGADTGATVERVKQIIMEKLRWGDPDHGVPPDLYALSEMGAPKKMIQDALDEWNEITKQNLDLEEALLQSMPDDIRSQAFYDDAGNLVLPGGKFEKLEDVPEDVARSAFQERARQKGIQTPEGLEQEKARIQKALAESELKSGRRQALRNQLKEIEDQIAGTQPPDVTPDFIADVEKVIPNPAPIDLGMDMMAYGRSYGALDSIVDTAKAAAQRTPTTLSQLPAEAQNEVRKAIRLVKNDMAGTRYQAMKFGEWRRDSALLNYNRRTNFDNYLGHAAPFVFWSTSSMFQWAIESIDRPAMLTNYLRTKKLFETAGLQRDDLPTRAKGKIRIDIPWAPEWMGEQFIDPLRMALPFDNWLSPFEQVRKNSESLDGRTERLLEQQLQEGSITQDEYDAALENRDGSVWEFARTKAAGNDNGDQYDAWDFATAMASPHAPIMWAYNASFGNKEDIAPFSPMSRLTRNAATMLGVEDWNNSKWNVEAKVRKQLGLPAFDKWDDYRVDRSLANLAGDGSFTYDEVKEAMAISALVQQGKMTPDQAKEMSEAYREGVKRSNLEYSGGGVGAFALNLLGVSVTSVPKGETELRKLTDDFSRAYSRYKEADDSLQEFIDSHPDMEEELAQEAWAQANPKLAKSVDDLTEFFDQHPEYEARLGIFDSPEERMHKFMVDSVWSAYNEMPKLNKDEVREHLGDEFQTAFLDKATRAPDQIPVEQMAVWLKMMHVDPLGGLTADQRLLVNLYGKVKLTDPETANRVQVFYDVRNKRHEGWYEAQTKYYELPKGKRKNYLKQHPELKQYWDFRKSFMMDNPDLVPYLTDDEKAIERAKNQARTTAAVPTAAELQKLMAKLPPDVGEIVNEYAMTGEDLPPVVIEELEYIAGQNGLDPQQFTNILGAGMGVR